MAIAKTLFNRTLNSVIFGITLMFLLAVYIAVGSGLAGVREYFEMNEMQFFAAWPLKVLMVLLVANLIIVTWTRIPLTPPRYGVWCIHLGIITLILGMGGHYWNKVEGQVKIPIGQTVDHFYDNFERALYVRHNGEWVDQIPLDDLPRFKDYGAEYNNVDALDYDSLRDIQPGVILKDGLNGQARRVPFAEAYDWANPLKVDVIGYWPYAAVPASFATDEKSTDVGVRLAYTDPDSGTQRETWLMSADQRHKVRQLADGAVELDHRHQPDPEVADGLKKAAGELFRLNFAINDGPRGDMYVEVGKPVKLGDTGYEITVESFDPAWPMFGTGEIVKTMTMMVKSPTMTYRRMILEGKPIQTDFKLDDRTAGPMGKRQTEPLDKSLSLGFVVTDAFRLLPVQGMVKHTLVTSDKGRLIDIAIAPNAPPKVTEFENGRGTFTFVLDHSGLHGPMQQGPHSGHTTAPADSIHGGAGGTPGELLADDHDTPDSEHIHDVVVNVARVDNIVKEDNVVPIPSAQRDRGVGQQGLLQAVRLKVSMGDWSEEIIVPFTPEAGEMQQWPAPVLKLPGEQGHHTVQFAFCNSRMRLPGAITVEHFELVPYPGADANAPNALIRDFRSTLVIEDPRTQLQTTGVAHMNNPVYYDNGRWLFFQAAYDGQDKAWTVLGIGNRPGVYIMTIGCVMVFVGLIYAFYLKPIVIRKMKENAIAEAKAKKTSEVKPEEELATVS